MLKSSENMLGYKMKIRLSSLPFDCNLCEDEQPLVRALLSYNMGTGLPRTGMVSGTLSLSQLPCPLNSQGVKA